MDHIELIKELMVEYEPNIFLKCVSVKKKEEYLHKLHIKNLSFKQLLLKEFDNNIYTVNIYFVEHGFSFLERIKESGMTLETYNDYENLWELYLKLKETDKDKNYQNIMIKINENLGNKDELLLLYKSNIHIIPGIVWSLEHLTHLDIYDAHLETISEDIGRLINLYTLRINNCRLKIFPKSVLKMTFLKQLGLSNNKIPEMPEAIIQMEKLITLWLDNNNIKKIPEKIVEMKNLKVLCLDYNHITEIPEEISDMKNLEELAAENNPIAIIPNRIYDKYILFGNYTFNSKDSIPPLVDDT